MAASNQLEDRTKELEIKEINLLSMQEAEELPVSIRTGKDYYWWLRTPGDYRDYVVIVDYSGRIVDFGDSVDVSYGSVRPALRVANLESLNLDFGDEIKIFGKVWLVIGNDTVLAKKPFCQMAFRKNSSASDANKYEASEIKTYLDSWLAEQQA